MTTKRITIVFEETDDKELGQTRGTGQGFIVYVEGFTQERFREVAKIIARGDEAAELKAAEFWGAKMFLIIQNIMKQTGVTIPSVRGGKA